ncbi:ROK family protein [Flagellimonas allohymeniacidonis]|uniref:ROK family protein n=1 Tax=Flagellimonas allohymeniacidonis TaxID=2517819 RepID=A0A4Q8QDD7_9FLAO|nr:ROK family protein [Allomuricauda hymeniacidonis]TAI47108.1 ROK family protein [Allomuricauda hymeniacidonis]
MDLVIGIDIGGTKTKIGLVNSDGKCLEKTFFRTREYPDLNDYLDRVAKTSNELLAKYDGAHVLGCGIGAPNASSKNGTIENASNLLWKGSVPILSELQKRLDMPMRIMNDASAAALGEMLFGSAKNIKDFIAITLGTGFGAGIVANGQLIDGYDGFAGELGHVDMTIGDGRLTGLGVKGGLEAYVSATGLKRTIMYMLSKYMIDSRFKNVAYNDLHGEDITQAAEEGDEIALKAFDYTAKIMAQALANFTAFTQPEAFILMGGLVNSGKWILEPLESYFNEFLLDVYKGKVKIMQTGMEGKTAAICGAAALIWEGQKS